MPQEAGRNGCVHRELVGRWGSMGASPSRQGEHTGAVGHLGSERLLRRPESAATGLLGSELLCFLPCPPDDSSPADIFAVGFEEMVELSAGNIVNAR